MSVPAARLKLEEFLDWENAQSERHEFYRGEVFSMVGARRVHGIVAGNVFAALRAHVLNGPCQAFTEGYKVEIGNDAVFYPDVFVTCDRSDLATDMIFRHPLLVVEVLSESTQAFDRGLKFAAYRRIEALREYVLIDPDTRCVEVYRRNERSNFELIDQSGAPTLELASAGLTLPMDEVFVRVEAPGRGGA